MRVNKSILNCIKNNTGYIHIKRIKKHFVKCCSKNHFFAKILLTDKRINTAEYINEVMEESIVSWDTNSSIIFLLNDDRIDPIEYYMEDTIRHAVRYDCACGIEPLLSDKRFDMIWFRKDSRWFDYTEMIQLASKYNCFGIVKLLLDDGRFDPTQDDEYTAVQIACIYDSIDVIKLFFSDPRVNLDDCIDATHLGDLKDVCHYVHKYRKGKL